MKQYTIGELMAIDSGRIEKAGFCQVNLVKTFHELKTETLLDKFKAFFLGRNTVPGYYVVFKFEVMSEKGNKYYVFIKTNPDFNLQDWATNKVQIYCNCPDFMYRSAYELGQHKSLFLTDKIKIALGEALTVAPKRTKSLLCKHSYAALSWLVDNYSSVMKMI